MFSLIKEIKRKMRPSVQLKCKMYIYALVLSFIFVILGVVGCVVGNKFDIVIFGINLWLLLSMGWLLFSFTLLLAFLKNLYNEIIETLDRY